MKQVPSSQLLYTFMKEQHDSVLGVITVPLLHLYLDMQTYSMGIPICSRAVLLQEAFRLQ